MPSIVGRHITADGTEILVRHWPFDPVETGGAWAGPPWASVLIVHGLAEHSGRYERVGDQFTSAGLDARAYDHRGMGGSGGRRGDIETWSSYHDDLAEQLATVRSTAAGRPVVLFGHSLGGLIAAGYLLGDRPKPDLVVLTAPAFDSTIPGWKRTLARAVGRIAPTFDIRNDIRPETLSRDPSVGARTADDPWCVRTSTARFGVAALAEQERVRREAAAGFGRPTLVLHGEDDGLVPVSASEVLETAPLVDRRTYPGLRHELLNEPEGPAIEDEIIAWIRAGGTLVRQPNTASGERTER